MTVYTFFDVETPNRQNDRICSIGIERVDANGKIEYSEHFYVNPEQGFDAINRGVHHISPAQVKGQPIFADLWQRELASVVKDSVMVAHNAPFDIGVLGKTLDFYGLEKPSLQFIDTCDTARHFLELPDYKLPTVCNYYGVELTQHHDAMADTQACEGIYWAMAEEFGLGEYVGLPHVWVPYDSCAHKASSCDQVMTDLYGITLGLSADMVIRPEEIAGLQQWMQRNEQLRKTAFICDAFALLEEVLSDGIVTPDEHNQILNLARPFVQNGHNKAETVAMQELIGFLRGIACDKKVNIREAKALQVWMDELKVSEDANFAAVRSTVSCVLRDGVIDDAEESELLELFERIVDPASASKGEAVAENQPTEIAFAGNRFVLTGEFSCGEKKVVEEFIKVRGGEIAGSVSGKVAYVVQGGEGSGAYAYGNYGSKIKKAMELQDAGKPIQIIQEEQLGM